MQGDSLRGLEVLEIDLFDLEDPLCEELVRAAKRSPLTWFVLRTREEELLLPSEEMRRDRLQFVHGLRPIRGPEWHACS